MKITLLDDERLLSEKIAKKLDTAGYLVEVFHTIQDFYTGSDTSSDLYLIDIGLPDGSGIDVIGWLRSQWCQAPVMIMSGYGDSDTIVNGLETGADDYLTKPFSPDVLLARIKAVMRRPQAIKSLGTITYADLEYNLDTKEVRKGGIPVPLAKKELLMFELFLNHIGKVVEKEDFIRAVWGTLESTTVSANTVNVTLSKLKSKVGENFRLKTLYNTGYILEQPNEESRS